MLIGDAENYSKSKFDARSLFSELRFIPAAFRVAMQLSPNFSFLEVHDPQLVRLGTLAEYYFAQDPVTSLMKLRQFGELEALTVLLEGDTENEDNEDVVELSN